MSPELRHEEGREEILAAFDRDDPTLSPSERETTLRFARDEDRVEYYTEEHGIGRRLAAHPEGEVLGVTVRDDEARPHLDPEEVDPDDDVVAVRGVLPIGVLSVRMRERKADGHAEIVSNRVFEGGDR